MSSPGVSREGSSVLGGVFPATLRLVGTCVYALSLGACAGPAVTKERRSVVLPAGSASEASVDPARQTLFSTLRPVFPEPGAKAVCTDARLTLAAPGGVALGTSGTIRVVDVEAPGAPVDVIEPAASNYGDTIGGRAFELTNPVVIEAGFVHVRLRTGVLEPNRTYAVTIDDGVFVDGAGRSLGVLSDRAAWRFTTRAPSPAKPGELVVAGDGSGDFCSVQGAFDFVPESAHAPLVIFVKRGTYREVVFVENKGNVTLRGEDRRGTLVAATNNDLLQHKQGQKFRALAGFENVQDVTIENLTFQNTTPQGGSQAEALRVDPGERVIVRNATLLGRQDTLLLTGSVYVRDAYVEGNVDYVWGRGTAYFERVELRTIGRAGWTVQARNPAERYGYVFVDSTLSADVDISGHLLARIEAWRFPASHVAYIGCRMAPAIAPKGWEITPPGATETNGIRFWEYGSTDLDGKPLSLAGRHPAARRLTKIEAERMRDKRHVFGGWDPEAPSEGRSGSRASP